MTAWIEAFGLMTASIGASISIILIGMCVKAIVTKEYMEVK